MELIKRQGAARLGVTVLAPERDGNPFVASNGNPFLPNGCDQLQHPRIGDLQSGSWAQRADVLCVGDAVVGVNGASTAGMTQEELNRAVDLADRY